MQKKKTSKPSPLRNELPVIYFVRTFFLRKLCAAKCALKVFKKKKKYCAGQDNKTKKHPIYGQSESKKG